MRKGVALALQINKEGASKDKKHKQSAEQIYTEGGKQDEEQSVAQMDSSVIGGGFTFRSGLGGKGSGVWIAF